MDFDAGKTYQVVTGKNAQSPNFVGEYVGELMLAHGEIGYEFVVQGLLDGMPLGTKEWHPVLLANEIISVTTL